MIKHLLFIILISTSSQTFATNITINNINNQPVANAVVWLTAINPKVSSTKPETLYAMTQKNRMFTPRILIVPKNAKVEFPNADSIMHHVYSFSKAKTFELKLYKEQPKAPLVFEQTGVVELGCNIHDWMLGYIVVVDSMLFAITDEHGQVDLLADDGQYTLNVWHSGFSDISEIESQLVTVEGRDLIYNIKQPIAEQINITVDEFDDY